jgi:hypothetical protein
LTNLIKEGFHSPPQESFNLNSIPGGSPDDGDDMAPGPATPTWRWCQRRMEKQAQKAGSRKKKADDVNSFFTDLSKDVRVCDFCVEVFFILFYFL